MATITHADVGRAIREAIDTAERRYPGGLVSQPRTDALGRPVPEWAKPAFDILAADGRRVCVDDWPVTRGMGCRDSDAIVTKSFVGIWSVMRDSFAETGCDADAARRALAMESERKGQGLIARLAAAPPKDDPALEALRATLDAVFAGIKAAQDAEIAKCILGPTDLSHVGHIDLVAENERARLTRRHNTTCPRCYGPAYQGAGAVMCEREGGCLVDAEPTAHDIIRAHAHERDLGEPAWLSKHPEGWQGPWATRDLAVAAWREAVLARAKREAGL